MNYLLDSSALIAALKNETGAEEVFSVMANAAISVVNFTEVFEHFLAQSYPATELEQTLTSLGIETLEFDLEQAKIAAKLRLQTRNLGLSLGDRACLAAGIFHNLSILTADKAWAKLKIGANIKLIR